MQESHRDVLVGNSYPFSLIRRDVSVSCVAAEEVRSALAASTVHSYWGHEGTEAAASEFLGVSVKPEKARPAVVLSDGGLPVFDGIEFRSCYVCSPTYRPGFRPAIGTEVSPDDISGWQILKINWSTPLEEKAGSVI